MRMNSLRDLLAGIAARGETITYPALRQELQLEGDLVPFTSLDSPGFFGRLIGALKAG